MKVRALIEELKKFDMDASVVLNVPTGSPIIFALASPMYKGVVWLESKEDVDVADALHSRELDRLIKGEADESFYEDLHNHDITPYEVAIALGEEESARYTEYLNTKKGL